MKKDGNSQSIEQQYLIISELRSRLSDAIFECISTGKYEYLEEKRTFSVNDVIGAIEDLTVRDIEIGENDRLALAAAKSNDALTMRTGILSFRRANELRSKTKNSIDNIIRKIFER